MKYSYQLLEYLYLPVTNQCVFVDRLRPGEHSEPRPDLVKKILSHLEIQTLLDNTIESVVYISAGQKVLTSPV